MSESLVEIPVEKLSFLRDKFKVHWPKHIVAFSLISNLISRFSKFPESKETSKIYSLNNDWETDGTFVAITVRTETLHSYRRDAH